MQIWESENHFNLEVTELTDASCVTVQNFIFEVSYFVRRGKLKQTIYRVLLQHDCIQHLLGLQNHLSKFRSLSPSQHSPLSQIPKEGLSLAFWLESHNTFTLNFKNAKFSAKLNRSSPPSEDLRELSCILKNPWLIEQKISLNHIKLHNVLLICILCKLSYFFNFWRSVIISVQSSQINVSMRVWRRLLRIQRNNTLTPRPRHQVLSCL